MARTVHVTAAQVQAARLIISRAERRGLPVRWAIRKIAEAKRSGCG